MLQEVKHFVVGGFFMVGLFILAGVADSSLSIAQMLKWSALGAGAMVTSVLLGRRWCRDES